MSPLSSRNSGDFGYWSGSNDPTPGMPYTPDTTAGWGGSWTHHSEMGPPGSFNSTDFWEVGVWAGASNSAGNGNRRNQTWAWADTSLTVDCSGVTPVITENSGFTWCFEDEWTHEQGFEGLVAWVEGSDTPVDCTW